MTKAVDLEPLPVWSWLLNFQHQDFTPRDSNTVVANVLLTM